MKNVRVLILDDEMVIARDLERVLNSMDIHDIKIATRASEAQRIAKRFLPHLMLSDINLGDNEPDGITASSTIKKFLQVEIIYITAHSDPGILNRAKESRPQNYIIKPFEEDQVRVAVELAVNKPTFKNTGVLKSEEIASLTNAERRIVYLISENLTTKEIAARLFVSPKTVENHRSNIMRKLQLESRNNSLLTWAIAHKDQL